MHTNLLQSHPTLCNPTTLWTVAQPGSSVHGFLQARILEWVVAMLFFRGPSWPRDRIHVSFFSFIGRGGYLPLVQPGKPWIKLWKVKALVFLSHAQLFVTPWTKASQVPVSVEFSSQGKWSGYPLPPSAYSPHPGIKPQSSYCRQILYCLSRQGSPKLSNSTNLIGYCFIILRLMKSNKDQRILTHQIKILKTRIMGNKYFSCTLYKNIKLMLTKEFSYFYSAAFEKIKCCSKSLKIYLISEQCMIHLDQ